MVVFRPPRGEYEKFQRFFSNFSKWRRLSFQALGNFFELKSAKNALILLHNNFLPNQNLSKNYKNLTKNTKVDKNNFCQFFPDDT